MLDDAVDQVQVLHEQTLLVLLRWRWWWGQSKVEAIHLLAVLKMQVGVMLLLLLALCADHSTFHDRFVAEGLTLLLGRCRRVCGSWRGVLILERREGGGGKQKLVNFS